MYKRFLVGALVLAVLATALVGSMYRSGTARAAAQNLTYGYGICVQLTYQCLDLKGDIYQADNPIILYGWNATEDRFRWNLAQQGNVQVDPPWPFTNTVLDNYYDGAAVYYIEKKTATGHDGCVGMKSDFSDTLAWQTCGSADPEPGTTVWVESGNNYFVNVGWSDTAGDIQLMSLQVNSDGTTCNEDDGAPLYVNARGPDYCNTPFDILY